MNLFTCFKLFVFAFFFVTCSNSRQIPPKAVNGVLDLRSWNLAEQGIVKLDGEWEFYPFVLPDENGELPAERRHFIEVPRSWNGFVYKDEKGEHREMTGVGYGTYRLKILTSAPEVSLKAPFLGTAFSLFCEKERMLQSELVGKDENRSQPSRRIHDPISCETVQGELNLTVPISNYHNARGGHWISILLGTHQEVLRKREESLSLDLFLAGILFIMGSYHISLFYLRREDRSAIFFGVYCLLISLRAMLTGENYLYNQIPNIGYRLGTKLEYLTLYLGMPVFLEFIYSLYPLEIISIFRKTVHWICIPLSIFVVLFPPLYFTLTLPIIQITLLIYILYMIFILIKAIQNHRTGAKTFLFGFSFFSLIVTNDILHSNQIIKTGLYGPLGFVIFIFSQSFLLSSRFANAFRQVKDLTQNLEQKVEERTRTLEEATQTLVVANQEIADSRKETEELNTFIQNINAVSSLTDVMMFVMYYLETNYGYNTFWLVLQDKKTRYAENRLLCFQYPFRNCPPIS